jgi:hypothetical protein
LLCAVAYEVSITDITGWIFTKHLKHCFVIFDSCPPLTKDLHQVIQYGGWKYDQAGKDSAVLRVQSEDKFGADTKV